MAGDEVVAEWLGDVYAVSATVVNAPTRFHTSFLRFRDVYISNKYSASDAYIGKYHIARDDFVAVAAISWRKSITHFTYVDLYDLGAASYTGAQTLQIIGINEY